MSNSVQVVTAQDLLVKARCDLIQAQGLCKFLWPLHHRGARNSRIASSSKVLARFLLIFPGVKAFSWASKTLRQGFAICMKRFQEMLVRGQGMQGREGRSHARAHSQGSPSRSGGLQRRAGVRMSTASAVQLPCTHSVSHWRRAS